MHVISQMAKKKKLRELKIFYLKITIAQILKNISIFVSLGLVFVMIFKSHGEIIQTLLKLGSHRYPQKGEMTAALASQRSRGGCCKHCMQTLIVCWLYFFLVISPNAKKTQKN